MATMTDTIPPEAGADAPATIALVDDDRNILTSVQMALENEGYEVRTYTDGASALTALQQSPPDMAVLDIKMPRMDGMELLRRLRQKTDLPVIFLTSKDEEIDEVLGLRMGADDYVRKPFSQRLLIERIRAAMGDGPVYLTFDIDSLDPGFAPGTGTPEIGGLTPIQAIEIIRGCRGLNLVGADLVEVSPPYDPQGNTALLAANLIYEMLCVLPGVAYRDGAGS